MDIRNRPRIPVPDEDPYSVAGAEYFHQISLKNWKYVKGSGSSGSSGVRERSKDKPPKLPPRDSIYGHHGPHNIPKVCGPSRDFVIVAPLVTCTSQMVQICLESIYKLSLIQRVVSLSEVTGVAALPVTWLHILVKFRPKNTKFVIPDTISHASWPSNINSLL